jgi:hypothetical protein
MTDIKINYNICDGCNLNCKLCSLLTDAYADQNKDKDYVRVI